MQKTEISELISDNMNLVYYVINKKFPTYIHNEDIIQIGMVGLCRAANTWDENKSKFSSYAYTCIKNEISRYFRDNKKHQGNISLEYEFKDGCSLGETLVGDEDVNFIDSISLDNFIDSLPKRQKEVLECVKSSKNMSEASERLGISKQAVQSTMSRIKKKWSRLNNGE